MVSLRERVRRAREKIKRRFKPKPKPLPQRGAPVFTRGEIKPGIKLPPRAVVVPKRGISKGIPRVDIVEEITRGRGRAIPTPRRVIKIPVKVTTPKKVLVKPIKPKVFSRPVIRRRPKIIERVPRVPIKKPTIQQIREKTGFFVLQPQKEQTRLQKIQRRIDELGTQKARAKKGEFIFKRELELAKLQAQLEAVEFVTGIIQLPSTIKSIIKDPSQLRKIPRRIKEGGREFGQLIRTSPTRALVKIGSEIFILKGTGSALKIIGSLSTKAVTRISPKFKGVKGSTLTIPSGQKGKVINLRISAPVKKIGVPLKEQVRLAGKKVTAVSAQADRLVNLVKTKRVIRKPIPGEEKLSSTTKRLLNKFDRGKITRKQLTNLDNRIRIETKGAGNLLERSFFASPGESLRVSRLGKEPLEASLKDILTGDITFRTVKPQVLVFEDIKVQKFPKALKGIENKIKAGKTLSPSETNKLLQFQLKKSGQFKPIGALSKEPEITLAPGEIVKKGKTLAVTLINGRRVPIISAKVVKATPSTKRLLNKARKGNISKKELRTLRKNLRKETGFKPSISRRKKQLKRISVKRKLISGAVSLRKIKRLPRRPPKVSRRAPPRRPPKVSRRAPPRRPVTRAAVRIVKLPKIARGVRRALRIRKGAKPIKLIKISKRKKKVRKVKKKPTRKQAFNVFARPLKLTKKGKIPKLIKINKKPLTKTRARDLGAQVVDTSLSRRFKIRPTKGKPKKSILKVRSGKFNRSRNKFRDFRIVKGKRVPLKNTFIERKGKALLDTRGEKRGITLRRRIAMLKNLSKARRIKSRKGGKR